MTKTPDTPQSTRILSIDALRGFDMFWIMGGDALIRILLRLTGWSIAPAVMSQLDHVEWEGFRFYDLIFPLFLFLVGCVLPYSMEKFRDSPRSAYFRIARRTAMLVLLGLICNRLLDFHFSELRVAGVLQRIGLCYGFGALLFIHCRVRAQAIAIVLILLGYWAVMAWVPNGQDIAGDYSKEGNLAGYVDRSFLPGKIYDEYYGFGDNEGLLSTIPAIATVLLGTLAGAWLKSDVRPWYKVGGLVVAGLLSIATGHAWGHSFPIIKNLWTSSFVLVAGGWSLLLLAAFYAVIDVIGWKRWAFFWIVIGANAIAIFIVPRFIDFSKISQFFLTGIAELSGDGKTMVLVAGSLLAKWLFLWFLYRQRVFLRV